METREITAVVLTETTDGQGALGMPVEGSYVWIVQGLEYDIAAQGPTAAEAKKRFIRTLHHHAYEVDTKDPGSFWSSLFAAPLRFYDLAGAGAGLVASPRIPIRRLSHPNAVQIYCTFLEAPPWEGEGTVNS